MFGHLKPFSFENFLYTLMNLYCVLFKFYSLYIILCSCDVLLEWLTKVEICFCYIHIGEIGVTIQFAVSKPKRGKTGTISIYQHFCTGASEVNEQCFAGFLEY